MKRISKKEARRRRRVKLMKTAGAVVFLTGLSFWSVTRILLIMAGEG